ncbi:MAG: cupin domain-containing protein [Paracoccaceae bacterium]|nr:cupin domain-containing protein [Paracoccaceae bacterium]MDG1737427.1 cupin domain-containing protein [Paracoccaceae bacterium]MDG2257890.1 cupin domain-containing protein [Paracoccaceae bacterium]
MIPQVIDLMNATAPQVSRRLADIPDCVIEGDPHQDIWMFSKSPDGKLSVGAWVSTPGKWNAFAGKDEYCYIISGRCALIHEDGTRQEFSAGSSFFIPDGFRGFWEVMETCTKHFVIRDTSS